MNSREKPINDLTRANATPSSEDKGYDYLFKLSLLGQEGVGKTSLIDSFIGEQSYAWRNVLTVYGKRVKLHITDDCSRNRFRSQGIKLARLSQAVIVVFDLTDKASFNYAKQCIADISLEGIDTNIILVGAKSDLERAISQEEIDMFVFNNTIVNAYYNVSANENKNVDAVFEKAATLVMNRLHPTISAAAPSFFGYVTSFFPSFPVTRPASNASAATPAVSSSSARLTAAAAAAPIASSSMYSSYPSRTVAVASAAASSPVLASSAPIAPNAQKNGDEIISEIENQRGMKQSR